MRIFMAGPSRPPYAVPVLGTRALPPPARWRVYARKARRGYDKGRRRASDLFRTLVRRVRKGREALSDKVPAVWFWTTEYWRSLAAVGAGAVVLLLLGLNVGSLIVGTVTAGYVYATAWFPTKVPVLTWTVIRYTCLVIAEIFCFFLPDAEYVETETERGEI